MRTLRLTQAGLVLYPKPHSQNRWHLPVCSARLKGQLARLSPNNPSCWEEVDFDGCPTICYVFTGKAVKNMNQAKRFTSFFSQFSGYLGEGPAKEFFHDTWLKAHNMAARARNSWEYHHGIREFAHSQKGMSVRAAAHLSIT